jgi:tetratricopeptide (TPR) repeat protein
MLGVLGNLLRDQGKTEDARAHFDLALAIHRDVGNRKSEGSILGSLGELLARQGRFGDASEALRTGEALLREVGDQLGLVVLLCDRGLAEIAAADRNAARSALAAAEEVANAMGLAVDSEARDRMITLREALARRTAGASVPGGAGNR